MKYTKQELKDEYEQAVKRKGELYAEGYIEGLRDGQILLSCDSCGRTPNTIYTTSKGSFCGGCKPID